MATLITKLDNGKYEVITGDNFSCYGKTSKRVEYTLEEVLAMLSTPETLKVKAPISQKDLEDFWENSFEADVDPWYIEGKTHD